MIIWWVICPCLYPKVSNSLFNGAPSVFTHFIFNKSCKKAQTFVIFRTTTKYWLINCTWHGTRQLHSVCCNRNEVSIWKGLWTPCCMRTNFSWIDEQVVMLLQEYTIQEGLGCPTCDREYLRLTWRPSTCDTVATSGVVVFRRGQKNVRLVDLWFWWL